MISRRVKILMLVVGVATLAAWTIHIAGSWMESREALAVAEKRLNDVRSRRISLQHVADLRQALSTPHQEGMALLIALDREAASILERKMHSMMEGHNAEVLALSLAAGQTDSRYPIVRGELHVLVDAERLEDLLLALETGSPSVFLERVRIARQQDQEVVPGRVLLDMKASLIVYRDDPFRDITR